MVAHHLVWEQEVQSSLVPSGERAPQLWTQLTPDLRRQMAQHWAKMIQRMRQQTVRGEEEHNVWG
jgi:hypothetical protein